MLARDVTEPTQDAADCFDLVIIGAGPAGERAAAQAAHLKKRVAVVELEPEPGGAAVHTGTLPSKTLRETALYLSGHRARELYGIGIELDPRATVPHLMSRKNAIVIAESQAYRDNFQRNHVTYLYGHAQLVDEHTVQVTSSADVRFLRGDFILIATGSKPYRPPDIDFADDLIHDSDEILMIHALPRSLAILGGGVIGCEYACMFAALDVAVTLIDARDEILPFLDLEIVARLKAAMTRSGITLLQGRAWKQVERCRGGVETTLVDGTKIVCEQLLFAAGRSGATRGLGLGSVGIETDSRGYIRVDEAFRTSVPSIFAAGDVVGFPALASVSMEQGRVAICHAFCALDGQAMATTMPYGIYTIPEVSSYGETEESCRQKGIPYVVGRSLYANNPRGKITGDLEGITKLVVARETRKIIGVHVVGERASELVHIGQTAIVLGAPIDVFIEMVFNYPTLADSYKYAAYECVEALAEVAEERSPPATSNPVGPQPSC
jgi:NAD(P) transhydrogenase